jgi:hypothetical protein
MRRHHDTGDEAEINITPMLDIVFIMLIFFIVTTSFVKEFGIDMSRRCRMPLSSSLHPGILTPVFSCGLWTRPGWQVPDRYRS